MSKKLLKAIFTTFSILFIFTSLPLQASTWTGGTDTNWDTASNWDTGLEPTSTDDVIIPSGLTNYPLISSTGNAVKSVAIIGAGSSLEIGVNADLTINLSTADGLSNQGTLTVNGSLSISNTGDEGLFNSGDVVISSDGTITITETSGFRAFTNSNNTGGTTNNGTISISASNSVGLTNDILTTFINNGDLLIDGDPSGGGLENYGPFTNLGTLTVSLSSNPEGGAIYNEGEFTNSSCAKLTLNRHIDNTVGTFFDNDGILILTGSDNNFGTIANNAIIYKTDTGASLNTSGTGTLYNNLNTLVWTACDETSDWNTAENWSLDVEPDATYNVVISNLVAGTIFPSITSSANTAKSVLIKIGSSLEIESTGVLTVNNSNLHGVHILGALTNDGTLNIDNSALDGLRNIGVDASNAGEINISNSGDDGFFNAEEGEFVNYGTINIDGSQGESGIDNKGDFLIDGDIDINTSNSPTNGSVTNSSIFEITRCGTLTVNNEIDNTDANYFINYGAIFSTFNGVNEGTIENETVIYNLNGGTFTNDPTSNGFELTDDITTVWNACNTNINWTNAANWSTGVPDNTKDAIIPAEQNFYPVIMTPAEVDILTIEAGAEVSNESTLDAQTIDNSGNLFNDACNYIINIFSDLTNNASGEIINTGAINLVGAATFTDNGGLYTGNAPGTPPPSILYVDKDAISGNDDGTSWADAYLDLQDALTAATECPKEIWVAEGTYYPTSTISRGISFYLPDGVELYGGFNGTEALRSDRDFLLYETLLSGDIGTIGDNSDNSYQVIVTTQLVSVKIDGFTIADGNANETDNEVLQNDGGGLYNLGEAIVQNCIFEYNSASDNGAAMYNGDFKDDNTKIVNCIFSANSGSYAINNRGSSLSIINTLITGNDGGGISHNGSSSTEILDLDNSTIAGNKGHGVYIDETSLNAVNSIFWDNEVAGLQNEFAQISTDPNATVSFSCVEGGWTGNGSTNIGADPLFTTPINPTDSPTTAGDFTLQITSPAINTGNTGSLQTDVTDVDDDGNDTEIIDIDLAQNIRVQLSTLDMGAYEASESCNVESTTASWTGATDTDWNTPSNWCPYFVPTINDDVFIGDMTATNYPVIDTDVGSVKSITMTDGSLTLTVDGTINISNSGLHGINISKGTITNNGSIFINSTTKRGINGFGSPSTVTIENNGDIYLSNSGTDGIQLAFDATLNNNDGGRIFITDPVEEGLIVISGGEFFNDNGATTTISGAGENGLTRHVESNVFNSGDIYIYQSTPEKKLLLPTTTSILVTAGAGGIYNYSCASITFDDVLENNATIENDGIIHANGSLFINTGTFLQSETGIIFDPNNIFDSPGGTFTDNGNTLPDSQANSNTNIWTGCAEDSDWDTAENWSLEEEPQANYDVIITDITGGSNSPNVYTTGNVAQSVEISEYSTLTISSTGELTVDGGFGILTQALSTLDVLSFGTLNIDNATGDGLENQGTTYIDGILNIDNSTNNDINNTGSFTNSSCAETNLTGQINSTNNFTNGGLLSTTFNGLNTISSTFTNNGVINDSFDSFNQGTDIVNNGIIILPIIGCLGASISDALLGENSNLVVDIDWDHKVSASVGGTYNSANNTFTPDNTSIGVGTHTLDLVIEDVAASCNIITSIEVEIENCIQTWTGASSPPNTDWNDPTNWSIGLVPTSTDSVLITDINPLTNYPIIETAIEIDSLAIDLNASIEIAIDGDFSVANGITNDGTITNNGIFNLDGGNFDNNGTFTNETCATFEITEVINNSNTITNNGVLTSNTTTSHENTLTSANFTNNGMLYNLGNSTPFFNDGVFSDNGQTLVSSSNTSIWTGCNDDTDWNNSLNWHPNTVPSTNDKVFIGSISTTNYPVIDSDIGTIKSITMTDGSLTVNSTGTLSILNSDATALEILKGTINNAGVISITSSGNHGIQMASDATFNNNDGQIYILDSFNDGLRVTANSSFSNNEGAILDINNAGENGILRTGSGEISNSGSIVISELSPDKKLLVLTSILNEAGTGLFSNLPCASIEFDGILQNEGTIENDGIIHANGTSFDNTGTFLQSETGITFDPNNIFDSPGGTFTDNGNTLPDSQPNSTTNIWTGCAGDSDWDTAENWSSEEEPQANYDVIITDITGGSNSPNIYTAGNVAQSIEVENGAALSIDLVGELTIDNSNENGIENQGTITNSGVLNVSNSTNNDINNTGTFNNNSCAEMTLTGQITSSNNFSNNGLLTTTFNGTNTITGTFTNNGVINDSFDSFNEGADITNNSIIILPITGCFGSSISNALIDGGSSLVVDEDWFHSVSESIGGTYNSTTNTFTPDNSAIGVGTHILDIIIEDTSASCAFFTSIEVEIESCTQIWTGASSPANTDWNDPDNWNTGLIPLTTDDVAIADIAPLTNYPIIDTDIEVYSITIDLNASLDIASNSSFTVEDGLTNNGSLTNNGTIALLGGNFANNGTFSNQACAVFELEEIIENAGTFTNNGILHSNTVTSHQNIVTEAVFNNTGILYNKGMATPFITAGTFANTGRILSDTLTNVWTGCNNDTNWETPSNWSLGMIPNLQNIIIPEITPATNYPVITTTLNNIISLVVENASTLSLSDGADLTVINISTTGIDIEAGAILNINSGATVNVNNAPITGVNVDGTLNVNGDLFIVSANVGMNVGVTGIVNDEGLIEITEGLLPEKTGIISVVNFLEIQNGGTLEIKAGGNLLIDGTSSIVLASKKIGFSDGDTGIKIFNGGTLLSEATSTIEVINISGTGIEDAGEIEHSGEMTVTAEDVGVIVSNSFINDGSVDISKPEGLVLKKAGTGGASVVNFLEIQNGGTLEINSGGSVTVDGADVGPVAKINIVNDDTGIDVQTGGTLTSETNTTIEVINMSGLSKGIVNNGTIDHSGIADIIVETIGIQIQSGTVENSGDITISKIEGLALAAKKTGPASVVNFLEIQNGGTLEVKSGGTITIDGAETGPV
ncbi:MAG: beta strand repeat-containing protein, partial [Chitinophagales bacterium]